MAFDAATLPSSDRAAAASSTRSFLRNFGGSRNARYGGESSTARRRHAPRPRLTANVTLTGTLPRAVALTTQKFDRSSPRTVTRGADGCGEGTLASARNATAASGGSSSASEPSAVLLAPAAAPRSDVHDAFAVAALTVTRAVVAPELN